MIRKRSKSKISIIFELSLVFFIILLIRVNEDKNGDDEEFDGSNSTSKSMYAYLGRAITHSAPITGIEFGIRESGEVLISIGEDRYYYIAY